MSELNAIMGKELIDYLEPDSEPAFEQRQIQIKTDKWFTADFEILEFLGR